ncbi:hypothetical protein ASPCADRAFT_202971 [Aspergillus carbonarius ITEM 5010]|uniref:BTB domain-containing protein n=1 Tax=Aspergillus carbonarius (strain ITEM 5010) TaxID=602072 RepID=A0A1R3S313_ASPC5|nr:hypothetical protein ASPCADRAFT_202971 [Aspergillus carbonarius ITEM 5010]
MSIDTHLSRPWTNQEWMRDLLRTGDYSDLTISCKGYPFKVHRAIICPRWHHFNTAVSDVFKEPGYWALDLPDDDPVTIFRVLEYLYTEDYTEEGWIAQFVSSTEGKFACSRRPRECPIALQIPWNNIQVYLTAEKYQISSLMTLAAKKLHRWAEEYRRSVAFLDILEEVLTLELGAQSKLRSLFVQLTVDYIHDFIERPQFHKILKQFVGFEHEVLISVVTNRLSRP